MPNKLAHFAIAADDVERAKRFYEQVFGWAFQPWGPPNFYQIEGAGVHGALQERQAGAVAGAGMELTFAVSDLSASAGKIEAVGGRLVSQEFAIPGVGRLMQFADTEGNCATVMQYEAQRLDELGLA